MKKSAVKTLLEDNDHQYENRTEDFHSVELSLRALPIAYQFRIFHMDSDPMCFLVKDNSDILDQLKVGDTLDMKYYSSNSAVPCKSLATQISDITRKEQGRFKGHCLVGIEIHQ
jgi:hypothetical protein